MIHIYLGYTHSPFDLLFFFFNDTATTEIYTLSLHDALPIFAPPAPVTMTPEVSTHVLRVPRRSEEHTSELQSRGNLVCRLLLEQKKQRQTIMIVIDKKKKQQLHDARHTYY